MKKSNKSDKSLSSDIIRSKMIVDAAEKNAVIMNGEKIMNIPVDLCFVDKNYQREIRGTRSSIIMDMANNWDYAKAGQIEVSYREDEGKFAIIDGQGRWEAAKTAGLLTILANIKTGLSDSDEAKLFAEQDKNRVKVSEHAKFRAGLIAAKTDPDFSVYPELAQIMKANGVDNPAHVSAITVALHVMKKDPVECEWIFKTIRKANWHDCKAGYSQYVMKALSIIYEEQSEPLPKVDENLVPYMQKTNPGFFRDAAGTYGTTYVTKSRNVANIMMKLLCGDKVMTSKLKTLMAEANLA